MLLVGVENGAAIMENCVEFPYIAKGTLRGSSYHTCGYISKGSEPGMWKIHLQFHIYCSIYTVAKIWKKAPMLIDTEC